MSEPWLAPTVLSPSAWRRRFLSGAGAGCALVTLALARQVAQAAGETSVSMLFAATLVAAAASLAAAHAAWTHSAGAAAGGVLQIDARGRITLQSAQHRRRFAAGRPRVSAAAAAAATPATALYVGPLFVVLRAAGRSAIVWCDSLPRVGFRRLVVAARWGAGADAAMSRV